MFAELYAALRETYTDHATLKQMTRLKLHQGLEELAAPAKIGAMIFEIVEHFEKKGALEELLVAAWEHAEQDQLPRDGLRALYVVRFPPVAPAAAQGAHAPPPDPFDACRLEGDRLFVNQKKVRRALRVIAPGNGALVVMGTPRSGKSFTHWLILHGANHLKHKIVWIDVQRDLADRRPTTLATALLGRMGIVDPLPSDERVPALLSSIVGLLQSRVQGGWWLVVDGIEPGSLSQETRELLMGLARQIATTLQSFRVVLLGYDQPLLPPYDGFMKLAQTAPVQEQDLVDFFEAVYRDPRIRAAPGTAEKSAAMVWQKLPAPGPDWLATLNQLVTDALDRMGVTS